MQQDEQKDPQLWALAKKRAGFKRDLLIYFVVNAFFWILWLMKGAKVSSSGIPWPLWSTAGWGLGMVFYYISVYKNADDKLAEKEYDKLRRKN